MTENISLSNEDIRALIDAARAARENAYAPYSHYRVGAAIRTTEGAVFSGCNVENASYGATVCAERVALWNAVATGVRSFSALALVTEGDTPAAPCGICRQVFQEFSPDMQVICALAKGDEYALYTAAELLPHAFDANELNAR